MGREIHTDLIISQEGYAELTYDLAFVGPKFKLKYVLLLDPQALNIAKNKWLHMILIGHS